MTSRRRLERERDATLALHCLRWEQNAVGVYARMRIAASSGVGVRLSNADVIAVLGEAAVATALDRAVDVLMSIGNAPETPK